jgi:hypothetical protein
MIDLWKKGATAYGARNKRDACNEWEARNGKAEVTGGKYYSESTVLSTNLVTTLL